MFIGRHWNGLQNLTLADARDGTVNTILVGEIGRNSAENYYQGAVLKDSVVLLDGNGTEDWRPYRRIDDPSSCVTAATNADNPGIYNTSSNAASPLRGSSYQMGGAIASGFNTILPPNGPSCAGTGSDYWIRAGGNGIITGGSYHSGGMQVCMVDGSVKFISETIDTGDASVSGMGINTPTPNSGRSPYGVWGGLGTRAGGEVDSEF